MRTELTGPWLPMKPTKQLQQLTSYLPQGYIAKAIKKLKGLCRDNYLSSFVVTDDRRRGVSFTNSHLPTRSTGQATSTEPRELNFISFFGKR